MNTCDAQDITQDVFMKLLETPRSFNDEEHLKAWLIRVTINLCNNLHRYNKKFTKLDENIPAPVPQESSEVLSLVLALPENYKNVIYLHYYEGYTAKEIGDILKMNTNTVLSNLSRGRKMLKSQLTGGFDGE